MKKLVTLIVEFDPEAITEGGGPINPFVEEWDWDSLVGDEIVKVLRVEVYGAEQ